MKKIKQIFIKTTLLLSLLSSSLLAVGNTINYLNPFESAFNTTDNIIYGDYASIASSVECVDDGNGACDNAYDGYLFDATTMYKNSVSTTEIPLNSSTETLILPSDIDGKDILYAGLYWQGNITGANEVTYNQTFNNDNKHGGIIGRNEISMKDANGTIHALTADKVWYHDFWGNGTGSNGGHRSFYQAYKDVTNILQDSYRIDTTNDYTVGNIKASAGKDYSTYFWVDDSASFNGVKIGFWGNWQLIVVYSHSNIRAVTPQPKPKNIAIFHGFAPLIPLIPDSSKSIDINVTGFLTPKQAPVNAKMLFYGSGGEKKLQYDLLEIQDRKTTNFTTISNATNPLTGAFNGSISSFGVPIDSTISYYPGTDSDEFNVSNAMDTTQASTILRLSAKNVGGTGDQFFPGLIAFSTDVYEPSFCYDYAYKQLNRFFTEDNDGSQNPRIVGNVAENEPITVSIYLKNLVDSDVLVTDMNIIIQDINTSQARYVRNSTYLALNSYFKGSILDSDIALNGGSVSNGSINGIPIGNLNTNDYFYTYYDINTTVGTQDVNMTLNVSASYTLQPSSDPIPYTLKLSSDIPMCTTSSYQYSAKKGKFNIVHENYYDYDTDTPTKRYYNLPTQVTNRVGNFKVISIDENDTLTTRSAIVSVETIDAAAFHSALVSCQELASSISERIWMLFDAKKSVNFDKSALINAFNSGRTSLNPPSKLYENARENAAFRSSYPLDSQGNLQLLEHDTNTNTWKIKSFDYDQTQSCTSGTSNIGTICGSDGAGNSDSLNQAELTSCMECVYGISTQLTCSRDNFAIRPDSFSLVFNDSNETLAPKQKLIDNLTNVTPSVSLAAGYKYNIDINATNYLNPSASNGYTKLFNIFNLKDTMSYIWSPTATLSGCNDDTNSTLSFRISNGGIDLNLPAFNQVGRYKLNITDTSWTTVDNNQIAMGHHLGTNTIYSNSGDPMFALEPDGSISVDCIPNSSTTQNEDSITLNGCNISSAHSSSPGVTTTDIFTTFHPYQFTVTNTITLGMGHVAPPTSFKPFLYMSDLNQDENMSIHLNTTVSAVGKANSTPLSNYVNQCYAQALNLNIKKTATTNTAIVYKYIIHNKDSNGSTIAAQDISQTINAGNLTQNPTFSTSPAFFQKDMNGTITLLSNLNYNREVNQTANPEDINYTMVSVDDNATQFYADLTTKIAEGNVTFNQKVLHYYGRTNAPKITIECNSSPCTTGNDASSTSITSEFIYYEIFCQGTNCNTDILPNGFTQTNDIRWFTNNNHDKNGLALGTDGDIGTITEVINSGNVVEVSRAIDTANYKTDVVFRYNGPFPYDARMQMQSSTWLIYNESDANTTQNEFTIEFISTGNWNGKFEEDSTTETNAAPVTNTRIMW